MTAVDLNVRAVATEGTNTGRPELPPGGPIQGRRRGLYVLGAVIVGSTAWFSWSLPATASRQGRPAAELASHNAAWRWLLDHGAPPASPGWLGGTLVAVSVIFFAAWFAIVGLTWRRSGRTTVRMVVGLAALAATISALALPNQTSDVYDYALFGRVVAVHGGEAYHDVPNDFPDDPVFPYSSHQYTNRPDNKLPVWTLTAVGVSAVAGDSPVANLLAFRFLLATASVATTALVAWILGRINVGAAASGAAIFGLNPITVIYGTSKTDTLMALFLVAGLALVIAGRHYLATVSVTLSMLVKLITAPALVLIVAMPLPKARAPGEEGPGPIPTAAHLRSVALRVTVAVAVVAAAYIPFVNPFGLIRDHLGGSDHASVVPAFHPVAVAAFALALVLVAVATWRNHPRTDTERLEAVVIRSAAFLVIFAVFLTRPGLPWYLISTLAAVALARSRSLLGVMGILSAMSFLMGWWDAIGTRAHPLPPLVPHRAAAYLAVAALAGVLAAILAIRGHYRNRSLQHPSVSGSAGELSR